MFTPEEAIWHAPASKYDTLAINITVPGLSPIFPDVHCTANGEVCQFTIGEAECNAGPSAMALSLSSKFDLTKTYFIIAGIAGVNPEVGTLASVGIAKYAIQVALSYEIDAREKPDNWTTGYAPFGGNTPGQYPLTLYGTEVFELNEPLRDWAYETTKNLVLNDTDVAKAYRAKYESVAAYAVGAAGPTVIKADATSSDVWFTGKVFSEMFGEYVKLITNGTGVYGFTAEEESATLEAFIRAAKFNLLDFGRIIVLRSGSDFDRQPPGLTAYDNLFINVGAFLPSLANLYIVGSELIDGILSEWDSKFAAGIPATNYLGDIFGTLGGIPDFGPGISKELPAAKKKRDMNAMASRRMKRDPRVNYIN